MTYLIFIVFLIITAELLMRLMYYKRHGIKFIPKRVGEYPYNQFIEECGPPLFWRLKPLYGQGQVHINSLGLRAWEPKKGCRHLWVVGESELFGAKLINEEKIWFKPLQDLLNRNGFGIQVMNASVIGYNGHQTAQAVLSLPIEKDDILLIRPNMNDISLAFMAGSDWKEGTPWPMAFVHKLQRHKPWLFKLLDMSCLGTSLRRRVFQEKNLGSAFTPKPGFQLDRVLAHQADCLGQMIDFAQGRGARVGFFDMAFSYEPEIKPEDRAKLSAIQANWATLVEGWGHFQFKSMEENIRQVAEPLGLPLLRLSSHIWQHPRRYHLFLDLVHFNEQGQGVVANAFYEELVKSGLLTPEKSE